ncbi:phage tape measure protein [Solidesulfovibrio carbinoliphilus subsp. oakridgensis]|uniref:Phage tape measure protein n=1 Tax=Solidesulfovibrio carbinoliphilus subsp. oakridgensis TaxID=694327 RepID=G7QD28_9BACT|nr:tape measure protein [Solidesulfovibrio carbinoliphilus]EHJ46334.1 phage tape measure protein [Solidesulfovibrio carbinoliphilus subsp. oakridgensis]
MAAENRVRIIIEADNTSGRQGIQETVQDLDSLAAKGRGVDLTGALRLDAGAVTQPAAKAGAALDDVGAKGRKAGDDAGAAMAAAGAEIKKVGAEADNSGRTGRTALHNLGDGAAEAKAQAEALGVNLGDIRALAVQVGTALVAAFGVDQVISFANQVIGAAMAMEQLAATYKAVFKDAGAEQLRYAAATADAFGKSLLDVANSYKKFAAAAEAVGLSTDNQRKTFEAVTAAITKVGGSSQDVAGALLALEQMLSKGTVQAEEYRQQFAERIPGALRMGADALGVTTAAFQKMMENGQVIANDFIPKLTTQLAKFGEGWQATADTAQANAERLKNSFLELSNSSLLTGLVNIIEKIGIAFNENLTHNFEQFSVTFRALMAESRGDLSPFATITNSLDDLKKKLDALDQRKATYLKDLQEQARGLAEALVNVQTHQVDFGPSGENVEKLRQKLKWFEDEITRLTGQTWVVNVVAQVDNSQLIQAKSFIEGLIKGTAEYKSRALEAQQYSLDNAVNVLGKSKAALESKLTNPNLDLREAQTLSNELAGLNTQLDDAKLGYRELDKERKKLGEQQIKDNGAVAGFQASRAGISESELDKATRASDAHALSIARQIDAHAELRQGLIDEPGYYEKVRRAQEAEDNTVKNLTKSHTAAANAMERFESQGAAYLQSIENQIDALTAQLGGDNLTADLAKVDKRYDQLGATIRKAMIGAKGDVADYRAALARLEEARELEKQIAAIKAWDKAMDTAAATLKELGRLTGDPDLLYAGATTELQKWATDQERLIKATYDDEAARAQALADLKEEVRLKDLENQKTAFAGLAGASRTYWQAEGALLDAHLARIKDNCDSEYAYEVYAGQQRSELRKKELEARIGYEQDFASTLRDVLADEFGLYKDEITRQHESWVSVSKDIASGINDLSGSVATASTDMAKAWIKNTGSMADALKSAGDQALDYFMNLIQKMIEYALKNYIVIPILEKFVGSDAAGSILGKSGGTSASGSGGGLDLSSLSSLGKLIGRSAGEGLAQDFASAGSSSNGMAMVVGDSNALSNIFADGVDASALGKAAGQLNYAPTSAMASTYSAAETAAMSGTSLLSTLGTTLGVIGGVAGLVGLATSLLSTTSTTEKTGSGYKIAINAGTLDMSGVDFYKTTTTSGLGGTSTSHSTVNTGAVDPDVAKQLADFLKDTAESLHDFAKELGISTDALANFTVPEMTITSDQLGAYQRNISNLMAYAVLDAEGLRGAIDYVLDSYETYDNAIKDLGNAYGVVGGYTDAYGYDLETLAGITQENIDAIREYNNQVAEGTLPATLAMAAAMGASSDMLQILASSATDTSVALGQTDEQLSKILQADYARDIIDAVGEDTFKQIMGNLVGNLLTSLDAYQRQADYYQKKAEASFTELARAGVTVDNFWQSFSDAMHSGLSVEQFEAWGDASAWVANLDTMRKAIEAWNVAVRKVFQSLQARQLSAAGYDTAASAVSQLASAEWELYDARQAGYDETVLAAIAATQQAEAAKALTDILADVQGALDDVSGSSAVAEIQKLKTQFADWTAAAQILGATEEQLAQIREAEATVIAGKLQGVLDDAQAALVDAAGGSDMASWLADTKEKFAGWIASAQALEASEAQLAQIRDAETAAIAAKLQGVLDSVADQWNDATRTDTKSWLSNLRKSMQQATDDATALGASEAQLAQIRRQESDIIAAKLRDTMAGVAAELATFDGTELTYNVGKLKSDMAAALYDAALLGASQADLSQIGTLYAYKIKDAYQQQIDDLVDQLQSAADAIDKFSDSLKDFLTGLWTNKETSPLGARGRYSEAQSQFRAAVGDLSSTDDATRQAAQDKVQNLASTYLTASKDANATFAAYYTDFMEVQTVLGAQYQQAKTDHDLLEDQLKAATGTQENTKSTADLMAQLKALQQQQGDTWTQMLADLPQAIADAILAAQTYKQTGVGGGGGAGLSSALAGINSTFIGRDIAAQQANSQYLADKAAQLTQSTGKTWTSYQVLQAIRDIGLTPYQHYQQYGKGEGLSWTDSNAFSSDTNTSYTRLGSDNMTSDGFAAYLDPADYVYAKALQLSTTTGRVWTAEEVSQAFKDAGLTAAQHYLQYGQYEGIKAGSGYVGSNDYSAGSSFNATDYLAAKTASLNANNTDGHTWTIAQTAAAIAAAGMTPEQHYAQYGKNENIPGYAVGGLVGDLARSGGYLPGYSAGDVLTARLRLGEYVFTPEAVDYYGLATMEAMNAMRLPPLTALPGYDLGDTEPLDAISLPATSLPGYADGGLVGRLYNSTDSGADSDRTPSSGGRSTDRGYAALAGSVADLAKAVDRMSGRLDKQLGKVVDNTGRVAVMGVKIIESAVAS